MSDLQKLQKQFDIPGLVRIDQGQGGLTRINITSTLSDACIYLHGAHVTHYQPRGQKPVLFMSSQSYFDSAKPIRGGVPICFPWFGPCPENPQLPAHGFARLKQWNIESVTQKNDAAIEVTLTLAAEDFTRSMWAYDFQARYVITVGKTLDMALTIKNTSAQPFTFSEALHSYFNVADIKQVSVEGLAGATYLDKTQNQQRKVQDSQPITFTAETDRAYVNTRSTCTVRDAAGNRTYTISKAGSDSTVVWNPWIAKAKAMPDFGDEEWPFMMCLETANAADNTITLSPGQSHTLRAIINAE